MVRDINGLGGYSGPQTKTEQSSKKPAEPAAKSSDSNAGTPAAAADDVKLSNEAQTLRTLADKVNNLPEVNVERAARIKAALENGEYQVNDLVLADKILNSEALLGK